MQQAYLDYLRDTYKDLRVGSGYDFPVEFIETGSLWFNRITGGGLARGRVSVFWGNESSGKTTTALTVVDNAEKVGFVDVEGGFTTQWAKKWIKDLSKLIVAYPSVGETALRLVIDMISKQFDLVILDSIASLLPQSELEGKREQAAQARLMNRHLRELCGALASSRTAVLFLNQVREKVGEMYGSPETLPGGRGILFVASLMVKFRRGDWLEEAGERKGIQVRLTVTKNKLFTPWQTSYFNLYWDGHIDTPEELARLFLETGEATQKGSYFEFREKKFHGKESYLAYVRECFSEAPGQERRVSLI